MSVSVPVDDLANNTDALLQRVQQGETVGVTDNGEPDERRLQQEIIGRELAAPLTEEEHEWLNADLE